MRKLRLTFWWFFSDVAGGAERHSLALIQYLSKTGFDVEVIDATGSLPGHKAHPVPVTILYFSFWAIFWRCRHVWNSKIETIWIVPKGGIGSGSFLLEILAWYYRIPLVSIEHSTVTPLPPMKRRFGIRLPGLSWSRQFILVRSRLLFPLLHICVCHEAIRCLQTYLAKRVLRAIAIPNGVDTVRFQRMLKSSAISSDDTRRSEAVPFRIGYIGRLSPGKGLACLIRAFGCVVNEHAIPATLTIVGEGPELEQILKLRSELKLCDTIRIVPATSFPEAFYNEIDVCVLPSELEGLPLVILEALACECPVIASSVGGIPEVITTSAIGTLIPPGNVARLSAAIVECYSRNFFSPVPLCRQHVLSYFSIETMERRYREVLLEIAGEAKHDAKFDSNLEEAIN